VLENQRNAQCYYSHRPEKAPPGAVKHAKLIQEHEHAHQEQQNTDKHVPTSLQQVAVTLAVDSSGSAGGSTKKSESSELPQPLDHRFSNQLKHLPVGAGEIRCPVGVDIDLADDGLTVFERDDNFRSGIR
jgi:hypothetical protein